MEAAAILDFYNFKFLTVGRVKRVELSHHAPNFVAIGPTVVEIWRFFDFSKLAAVHHLGFVMRVFGPPIHEGHLVVFITMQNLVGIDSIICKFLYFAT